MEDLRIDPFYLYKKALPQGQNNAKKQGGPKTCHMKSSHNFSAKEY